MGTHVGRLLDLTERALERKWAPQRGDLPEGDRWDTVMAQDRILRDELRSFAEIGRAYEDGTLDDTTRANLESLLPDWTDALSDASRSRADLAEAMHDHAERRLGTALDQQVAGRAALAEAADRLSSVQAQIAEVSRRADDMVDGIDLALRLKSFAETAQGLAGAWNAANLGKTGAAAGELTGIALGKVLPSAGFNPEAAIEIQSRGLMDSAQEIADLGESYQVDMILASEGVANLDALVRPVTNAVEQVRDGRRDELSARNQLTESENIHAHSLHTYDAVQDETMSRSEDAAAPAAAPGARAVDSDGDGLADMSVPVRAAPMDPDRGDGELVCYPDFDEPGAGAGGMMMSPEPSAPGIGAGDFIPPDPDEPGAARTAEDESGSFVRLPDHDEPASDAHGQEDQAAPDHAAGHYGHDAVPPEPEPEPEPDHSQEMQQ